PPRKVVTTTNRRRRGRFGNGARVEPALPVNTFIVLHGRTVLSAWRAADGCAAVTAIPGVNGTWHPANSAESTHVLSACQHAFVCCLCGRGADELPKRETQDRVTSPLGDLAQQGSFRCRPQRLDRDAEIA